MLGEKASSVFLLKSSQCLVGKQKKVGQSDRLSKWPVQTYFIMIIMIHVYHPNEFTHICAAQNIFGPVDCSIGLIELLVLSHLVPRIYFRDQMTLHICKYGQ